MKPNALGSTTVHSSNSMVVSNSTLDQAVTQRNSKLTRRKVIGCLASAAAYTTLPATPLKASLHESDSDFRKKLEAIRIQAKLPGLITGYVKRDGDFRVECCGTRNSQTRIPLQINDRMHLGSCTKSMTATLIAMFISEEKIRWDSTLGELCRGVGSHDRNQNAKTPASIDQSAWSDVTVAEIVEHVAGLPANAPWSFWLDRSDIVQARQEIAGWLLHQTPPQATDKSSKNKYLYSNVGYMLLGHFLERIEKKPWEAIIQERLFEPLGMKTAGFGSPAKIAPDENAWGHYSPNTSSPSTSGSEPSQKTLSTSQEVSESSFFVERWIPIDQDNPPVLGPAGTVHASMEDWAKYLRTHLLNPGESDFPFLIDETHWSHLHRPRHSTEYAGGWLIGERGWADGPVYFHNGSNTMWYCMTFVAPKKGVAIFGASNCGLEASEGVDKALQLVLSDWL